MTVRLRKSTKVFNVTVTAGLLSLDDCGHVQGWPLFADVPVQARHTHSFQSRTPDWTRVFVFVSQRHRAPRKGTGPHPQCTPIFVSSDTFFQVAGTTCHSTRLPETWQLSCPPAPTGSSPTLHGERLGGPGTLLCHPVPQAKPGAALDSALLPCLPPPHPAPTESKGASFSRKGHHSCAFPWSWSSRPCGETQGNSL